LQAQIPHVRVHATQDIGELLFTTVYQDSQGWIWLGGQNGVYRYDGQEFMPIKLPEKMEPSPATALYESGGRLWVGFQSGMIAYLPNISIGVPLSNGNFEEDLHRAPQLILWAPEEGLPKRPIKGIVEDPSGACWISTYGEGLYVWKEQRLYQFNTSDDGLAGDDIYAMTIDKTGRVWLATDGGISICSMPEKGKKVVQNLTKKDGLPDEIITTITTDYHGNIWAGTDAQGVFRYNMGTGLIDLKTPAWAYGPVTSLSTFGDNEVWIGTEKNGIIQYDAARGTSLHMPNEHTLASAKIRAMRKDREGLLWVIANRGSLYSSNVRFGFLETPFSIIQAFCSDKQGRIWMGSREGLFYQKGGDFIQVLSKKENIVSLWLSPLDVLFGRELWETGSFY
jgi:ligand-binding sensor domain-containing protein